MNTYKVLVHPVRSRIVACLGGRKLTRRELERMIPEVPPPTLYRNLRVLQDAGMVGIAERHPRRGVDELVYEIVGNPSVTPQEMSSRPKEDWLRGLENHLRQTVLTYRTYLAEGGNEPCPAGTVILNLTPEERNELGDRLQSVIRDYVDLPAEGRERLLLTLVYQPDHQTP